MDYVKLCICVPTIDPDIGTEAQCTTEMEYDKVVSKPILDRRTRPLELSPLTLHYYRNYHM
jgi:hypothetical protein